MAERKKSASTKTAKRSTGTAKKISGRGKGSSVRSSGSSSKTARTGSSKTTAGRSGSKSTAKRSGSKSTGSSTKAKNLKKGAEKRMTELSGKRKRQYKHVLESEKKEGRPVKAAKRIAMATVNKTRKEKGETKKSKRS